VGGRDQFLRDKRELPEKKLFRLILYTTDQATTGNLGAEKRTCAIQKTKCWITCLFLDS